MSATTSGRTASSLAARIGLYLVLLATCCCILTWQATAEEPPAVPGVSEPAGTGPSDRPARVGAALTVDQRLEQMDANLNKIYSTVHMAEVRSYQNKMMSLELIRLIRAIAVVLVVIALVFPATIWLISKKRLLGLSGLSDEVTATLLLVEERQAKLANLMKEIQSEMDYVQSLSAPDLKNLVQQAEKYLEQNRRDLESIGLTKGKPGSTEPPQ
ncbi:MAG: hypothetical protein HY914_07740 [Desulfomonile tiedjei]|nr:hypothetical protein [Desulfomonile tiedjei]